MKEIYFNTRDLAVGYKGKDPDPGYRYTDKKGRDTHPDRSQRVGKVNYFKEHNKTSDGDKRRYIYRRCFCGSYEL